MLILLMVVVPDLVYKSWQERNCLVENFGIIVNTNIFLCVVHNEENHQICWSPIVCMFQALNK